MSIIVSLVIAGVFLVALCWGFKLGRRLNMSWTGSVVMVMGSGKEVDLNWREQYFVEDNDNIVGLFLPNAHVCMMPHISFCQSLRNGGYSTNRTYSLMQASDGAICTLAKPIRCKEVQMVTLCVTARNYWRGSVRNLSGNYYGEIRVHFRELLVGSVAGGTTCRCRSGRNVTKWSSRSRWNR